MEYLSWSVQIIVIPGDNMSCGEVEITHKNT